VDEDEVAGALLGRYGDAVAEAGVPTWLAVRWSDTGDIEAKPVGGAEGWLGHRLPPGWQAAAVVATGRVRALDAGHELAAGLLAAADGGLRLCGAVSRRRQVGWRTRLPDGTAGLERPSEGFILDVLLRAVGHPTPPPAGGPAELASILWLQAATALRCEGRGRLGWPELIGLHPLLDRFGPPDTDQAEALLAQVATTGTWEQLRLATAQWAPVGEPFPPPELAGWMDAGMFARWVLCGLPPLDRIVRMVRRRVTADAYHRLRAVLPPATVGAYHR
jgi:hypothetical protein